MIESISKYAETIITLMIAVTIIELILPNSKNKKYVMFSCSLIIMLSVINPILAMFNSDYNISQKIDELQKEFSDVEYSSSTKYDLNYNIYNTYINKLETNMKNRLEDIGYKVLESEIRVNKDTYEPESIEMRIKYEDGFIQPIVIDVFGNESNNIIYETDLNKIRDILANEYGVEKEKIFINM